MRRRKDEKKGEVKPAEKKKQELRTRENKKIAAGDR
jgi:hypothetical protein